MNNIKIIKHEVFGDLIYENELPGYSGEIEYHDSPLKVNFVVKNPSELENQITFSQRFLESDDFYQCFLKIIEAVLQEKNQSWLEEGEAEYTEEECYDFVAIEGIVFTNDTIDFYTYSLEMFWGYRLIIECSREGNVNKIKVDQ